MISSTQTTCAECWILWIKLDDPIVWVKNTNRSARKELTRFASWHGVVDTSLTRSASTDPGSTGRSCNRKDADKSCRRLTLALDHLRASLDW
jgi:hypothetical protein